MVGKYIKESTLVNTNFKCNYINLSTSTTVDNIGKGGWPKLKRFLQIAIQTYKTLKNFNPDLVYLTLTSTGIGFFKDALIVLLIKLCKGKLIYHFHNKGIRLKQDKWLYNLAYKFVFKNSRVILLAKPLYTDIKKYVPESNVHYCANGVPIEIISDINGKEQNKIPQVLFLSNLIKSKGVLILLKACNLLKRKNIRFNCIFVGGEGDITTNEFQKKIAEMQLQDFVSYLGKKYGIEKDTIYRNSDIFVLPTYYANECFPLVLLEAMQYTLPVISTPEGAISAIVKDGETGFLVQQKNTKELADKLEYLIFNSKLRLELGKNGRDLYLRKFTLRKFEENLVRILKQVN